MYTTVCMTGGLSDDFDTSISAPTTHIETERSRLSEEITAFERFSTRIENITADSVASTERIGGCEHRAAMATTTRKLLTVREAYTETVMNVPHYEEDYDDSYLESITEEFGPELGILLTQSNQFTPATKSALIAEIDEAIEQRKEFKKIVDREFCSLRSAATEVQSLSNRVTSLSQTDFESATFGALDAYLHQTDVLFTNCDEIARDRQHDLANIERSWNAPASSPDLPTYFYQSLPVTYPVLADLGKIGEAIESLQQDIEQAIIYEVEV